MYYTADKLLVDHANQHSDREKEVIHAPQSVLLQQVAMLVSFFFKARLIYVEMKTGEGIGKGIIYYYSYYYLCYSFEKYI